MAWFNYQHLYYFWVVSREGSIVKACERLHVSQPTVSAQIRALEDALGETLFTRVGKRLVLTDEGRLAARFAEEIFALGQEFLDTLKGAPTGRRPLLRVGITDVFPKNLIREILDPVFDGFPGIRLICREERTEALFLELAAQKLDILITDAPLGPGAAIKAFNHLLGESGMSFFGPARLAAKLRKGFPRSLDGAPMLVPMEGGNVRRSLEHWLAAHGLKPVIVGEFQDSALLDAFGARGRGVFIGPTAGEKEMGRRLGVAVIGRTEEVREPFYVISPEKKIKHPAVSWILEAARKNLGTASA
jgi:LysR family transcriptional activator of nhaA